MNTLTYNSNALAASAPSAGLWRRAANLYWTGWSQYAESMNNDTSLRPAFPVWSRRVAEGAVAEALSPDTQRLVDHAA